MALAVDDERRSMGARIGLMLLNLLTPGLGPLRLQRPLLALLLALSLPVLLLAAAGLAAVGQVLTPRALVAFVIVMIVAVLAAYGIAIAATWRLSALRQPPAPWWARWCSLLGLFLLSTLAGQATAALGHASYKPFYTPGPAMAPTLEVGDRLVADMRRRHPVARGDVILFDIDGATYIKRVVGLPGDRVAMADGKLTLNGKPARQVRHGNIRTEFGPATVNSEFLPGRRDAYRVLDSGFGSFDDLATLQVPTGHLFVLGDNRDNSADSRVPRESAGVGLVPIRAVRGRALFRTLSADWRWLGDRIR